MGEAGEKEWPPVDLAGTVLVSRGKTSVFARHLLQLPPLKLRMVLSLLDFVPGSLVNKREESYRLCGVSGFSLSIFWEDSPGK